MRLEWLRYEGGEGVVGYKPRLSIVLEKICLEAEGYDIDARMGCNIYARTYYHSVRNLQGIFSSPTAACETFARIIAANVAEPHTIAVNIQKDHRGGISIRETGRGWSAVIRWEAMEPYVVEPPKDRF
jgi:hypothetical protein